MGEVINLVMGVGITIVLMWLAHRALPDNDSSI